LIELLLAFSNNPGMSVFCGRLKNMRKYAKLGRICIFA